MTPRFKGKPNFDFSLPCPLCGYKMQPTELMRLASHIIQRCLGIARLQPGFGRVTYWVRASGILTRDVARS